MIRKLTAISLFAATAVTLWGAIIYNDNIVAIFGSGNPDTGWTSDSSNGITLALRAKNRDNGSTANVNGVYTFATAPAPRGEWNYEFSINSDSSGGTRALSNFDYYLSADGNPTQCITNSTVNALTHWSDNSYGNSMTANGQGVEGTAAMFATTNSIAQGSQNITFGDYPGGPQVLMPNATYNYELYAVKKGKGPNGARLASVGITVVVGSGGETCNVPTTKDQCKNDGWMTLTRLDGTSFHNQGDCIQYVKTGR